MQYVYTFSNSIIDIYQLLTVAINASKPMGYGQLHYEHKNYSYEEIYEAFKGRSTFPGSEITVDYFRGRMVKITIIRRDEGAWSFVDSFDEPRTEYQSWADVYPTYESLVMAAYKVKKPTPMSPLGEAINLFANTIHELEKKKQK